MKNRQLSNLSQSKKMFDNTSASQMHVLVRYATLAANGHNTQPWKFAIQQDLIEIHPDYSRNLPVADPSDRELWISLGCALENLILAAQAMGYAPEITYPDENQSICVKLTADTPQSMILFDAIPQRQTTRSIIICALWVCRGDAEFSAPPIGTGTYLEGCISMTSLQLFLNVVVLFIIVIQIWRLISYRKLLPCPFWLGWMVSLGNVSDTRYFLIVEQYQHIEIENQR